MKKTETIHLTSDPPDLEAYPINLREVKLHQYQLHRAKLSFTPKGRTVKIDIGSDTLLGPEGLCHISGTITEDAAFNLLELLNAWKDMKDE